MLKKRILALLLGGLGSLGSLGALAATGCQKGDPTLDEELKKAEDHVKKLGDKLGAAPAGGAQRPVPPAPTPQRGPDPAAVYAVPLGNAASKGPVDAKVTIVEGADFACPFCRMAEPTMDEIAKAYPNDVRFVFRHFVVHPQTATTPALAACAAQQQGKFWEMKALIWESAWEANPRPHMKDAKLLDEENMLKLAGDLRLNLDKFKADLKSPTCKDQIDSAMKELSQVGVDGTPAFYVNGRPISGAQPFQSFKQVIDEELKKADDAIKGGVPAAEYYEKVVIGKGKKGV